LRGPGGSDSGGTLPLSLVVPVFNEADTVPLFVEKVSALFASRDDVSIEFVFVNDGSTDRTLDTLLMFQSRDARIKVIDLSRNFGKEAALTAGLCLAQGQVIVPIDVDLQDPPEIIFQMIDKYREGYEVVLGRRVNRSNDTWAKRTSASWFYRIHNRISQPRLPQNVGDFRLMDRCVVDALKQMPESRRFMKGLFAWAGFKTACVDYVRPERIAGNSKFNGWKLWNFALEGITSFSTAPLFVWSYVGLAVACVSFILGIFIVLKVLIEGADVPGYASIMVTVTFLGGLQLIGIGVIGEYVGRTYIESKRRPVFLVRRVYDAGERHGS
jgi:polyisoprenyl-phosphate glycosyltransferase